MISFLKKLFQKKPAPPPEPLRPSYVPPYVFHEGPPGHIVGSPSSNDPDPALVVLGLNGVGTHFHGAEPMPTYEGPAVPGHSTSYESSTDTSSSYDSGSGSSDGGSSGGD